MNEIKARKLITKLAKIFNVAEPRLDFYKNWSSAPEPKAPRSCRGSHFDGKDLIHFYGNPSKNVVCHEFYVHYIEDIGITPTAEQRIQVHDLIMSMPGDTVWMAFSKGMQEW